MQKQSATVTENRKISFMESQIFQNGQNTIWKCSLCAAFVAITLRVLMNHYYTVHSNEVNFSVRCGINECPATFKRYHSFYKHIRKKHHHEYESKVKEDVNYQTVKFYFCAGNKKFLQIFCAAAGRKPP